MLDEDENEDDFYYEEANRIDEILEQELEESYREMYDILEKRGSSIFYENGVILMKNDPRPKLLEMQKYFEELQEFEKCSVIVNIISECDRIYKRK